MCSKMALCRTGREKILAGRGYVGALSYVLSQLPVKAARKDTSITWTRTAAALNPLNTFYILIKDLRVPGVTKSR